MKTVPVLSITLAVGLPVAVLPLVSCGVETSTTAATPTQNAVLTTFYPTQYFAERIAGKLVVVDSPLPADADPIFWRPGAEDMVRFQSAKLVVTNGAEFEKWVAGSALPRGRTVESLTDDALASVGGPITMETTTHSHGPAGEHTHEGIDGHTWVSPELAVLQARRIAEAMSTAWPEHAAVFAENLERLEEDLDMLAASMRDLTPRLEGFRVLASHPAYNYLAREMGWSVHNLDLDPEGEDVAAIVEAVHDALHHHEGHSHEHGHGDGQGHDHAHEHEEGEGDHEHSHGEKPVILLWEGEPSEAIERALREELGVTSVLFTPVESRPETGDYMDAMRANFDRLREAVGG